MGHSFAQYADGLSLGAAALRQALSTPDLPDDVYLERAVVVYAGQGQQADPASPLYPAAIRLPEGHTIDIQGPSRLTRLHVPTLVLLSEHDALGTWVHELGHTLYARQSTFGGFKRLSDRYDDRLGGQIGFWDLMGYGSRWGDPAGSSPTHMSSFTKESAGWLRYQGAIPDTTYVLTALECQRMGDAVLTVDDPLQQDPRFFYIIEARDHDAPYGAVKTGIVIYYVSYDRQADHAVVDVVGVRYSSADGSSQDSISLTGPLQLTILGESFAPYQVTVRIEGTRP